MHVTITALVTDSRLFVHESVFPAGPGIPLRSISHWLVYSHCEHSAWYIVGTYYMQCGCPDSGTWSFWIPNDKGLRQKAHRKTLKEQRIWKDPKILLLCTSCFCHLGQIASLTFCYPWSDNTAFLLDLGERVKWCRRYENALSTMMSFGRSSIVISGKKPLDLGIGTTGSCAVPSQSIWMTWDK